MIVYRDANGRLAFDSHGQTVEGCYPAMSGVSFKKETPKRFNAYKLPFVVLDEVHIALSPTS